MTQTKPTNEQLHDLLVEKRAEIIDITNALLAARETIDGWKATVSFQNSELDSMRKELQSVELLLDEGRIAEALIDIRNILSSPATTPTETISERDAQIAALQEAQAVGYRKEFQAASRIKEERDSLRVELEAKKKELEDLQLRMKERNER